jgi:hypothetical protein
MLIAGGHLERFPVVVHADPINLEITTVSGEAAVGLEENLAPVPGGATATGWTVYLPTPEPIGGAVRAAAASHSNLSADEPPDAPKAETAVGRGVVDLGALARRKADR